MFSPYISEFGILALAHFVAVASPGPDFAVVVRQSLTQGRNAALWTSLGIGTGIFLHVIYSLLGIGIIVSQSILAFSIMKYCAATYLLYIGYKSLRARPVSDMEQNEPTRRSQPGKSAYLVGLLTNALNPKATLFFVSLFIVVISRSTPVAVQAVYGVYLALATACWFSFLSCILTQSRVQHFFLRFGHWVDRCVGAVLIGLGIRLIMSQVNS